MLSSVVRLVWFCYHCINVFCGIKCLLLWLWWVTLTRPLRLSSACYGIVQVPTGPWFCRKCESQERAARVVSHTIHLSIHHLWGNSWNYRTVWHRWWTSCSWTVLSFLNVQPSHQKRCWQMLVSVNPGVTLNVYDSEPKICFINTFHISLVSHVQKRKMLNG